MSRKRIGLEIGACYGKWTILKRIDKASKTYYLCECSCDKRTQREVLAKSLKNGRSKSCGCLVDGKRKGKRKSNYYTLKDAVATFYDSRGRKFYVDEADIPLVTNHDGVWFVRKHESEQYVISRLNGKEIKLHNLIMTPASGDVVDHINGLPFDNRRVNLRLTTSAQNAKNRGTPKTNTSGMIGVHQNHRGKWIARIGVDGKRISLGSYDSFHEAKEARLNAELKYYGEYSRNGRQLEGECKQKDKDEESYES